MNNQRRLLKPLFWKVTAIVGHGKMEVTIWIVGAVVLISVIVIDLIWCAINFGWTTHVATLDCGEGRSVEIRADAWSEIVQPIGYMVKDRRKDILPNICYIGLVSYDIKLNSLSFRVLKSSDGQCIAVTEAKNPDVVLILHDFVKQWAWPYNWDTPEDEHSRRAHSMMEAVQKNLPDIRLVLGDGASQSIGISGNLPNQAPDFTKKVRNPGSEEHSEPIEK